MNRRHAGTSGTGISIGDYKLEKTNRRRRKGDKENAMGEPVPPVPRCQALPIPEDYPNACETLRCPEETRTVWDCEEAHCPHAWARRSREDRRRREEKDAAAREIAG
jgi:hypothetical protein